MVRCILGLWMLVVMGCLRAHAPAEVAEHPYGYADSAEYHLEKKPEASVRRKQRSGQMDSPAYAAAPPMAMGMVGGIGSMSGAPAEAAPAQPNDTLAADRMVFYDGYARIRVSRADDLVAEIEALVEEVGGRVERLVTGQITIRVPVEHFEDSFARVLGMGEVVRKSVSAADVTEAFTAVDLRLQTAKSTLSRLRELLAKAKEEQDKIRILREIQRLTEQIDRMEVQLRTLESLASLSRISIDIESSDAFSSGHEQSIEAVGLEWIGRLSPFSREDIGDGRGEALGVPDGMVDLDQKRRFIAESADGAVLWTAQLDNEPLGDADFWMNAISRRLAGEFAQAEVNAVGEYTVIRLVDVSNEPYIYLVGVRVDGKDLHVVQVYFPSPDHEQRYGAATLAVLGEVQG